MFLLVLKHYTWAANFASLSCANEQNSCVICYLFVGRQFDFVLRFKLLHTFFIELNFDVWIVVAVFFTQF